MSSRGVDKNWLAPYRRPIVVVDWGVLQAMPYNVPIPGSFTLLIPDRLFLEVLEKDSNANGYYEKMRNLLSSPSSHGRILVGKYSDHVIREESSPRRVRAGPVGAVHRELSLHIAQAQAASSPAFLDFHEIRDPPAESDGKPRFVRIVEAFQRHLKDNDPAELSRIQARGEEHISELLWRSPEAIPNFLRVQYPRFREKRWRHRLSRTPDECAAGRQMRIAAWYSFRGVASPGMSTKSIGNLFDDSHYVFLSLYTRYLCTLDEGMKAAARACSQERVQVFGSLEEIPVYPE